MSFRTPKIEQLQTLHESFGDVSNMFSETPSWRDLGWIQAIPVFFWGGEVVLPMSGIPKSATVLKYPWHWGVALRSWRTFETAMFGYFRELRGQNWSIICIILPSYIIHFESPPHVPHQPLVALRKILINWRYKQLARNPIFFKRKSTLKNGRGFQAATLLSLDSETQNC